MINYFHPKGVLLAGIFFFTLSLAYADCVCSCINGNVEAICQSSIDIQPICASRICPIMSPSLTPINLPRVPPIGTSSCHMAQVYDNATGNYVWRQICN